MELEFLRQMWMPAPPLYFQIVVVENFSPDFLVMSQLTIEKRIILVPKSTTSIWSFWKFLCSPEGKFQCSRNTTTGCPHLFLMCWLMILTKFCTSTVSRQIYFRDTWCTMAGVRRSFFRNTSFMREKQKCQSFCGGVDIFPLALVEVSTSYFSSQVQAYVIEDPVTDFIVAIYQKWNVHVHAQEVLYQTLSVLGRKRMKN